MGRQMVRFIFVFITILFMASNCFGDAFLFTELTGTGSGADNPALDGVRVANVSDDDMAMGTYNDTIYYYTWDSTSTASESVPNVVEANDNGTNAGRWLIAAIGNTVTGPSSSTDNAVPRFNGTGGNVFQDSSVLLDDSDNMTGLTSVTATTFTGNLSGTTATLTGALTGTTATLASASSLTLGTASTNTGAVILKNSTNANDTTVQAGAAGAALTFTLPTTDGGASEYLQTDGSGVLSWGVAIGSMAGTYHVATSGGAYTTIQAALDANTTGGETFIVHPGTYTNDTIAFTANNQVVVSSGMDYQNVTVTSATANIVAAGAFTGCKVNHLTLEISAATSAVDVISVSTGDIELFRCKLNLTNSSVATSDQPSIAESTGAATVNIHECEVDYNNAVDDTNGSTALKSAFRVGAGSTFTIENSEIDIDGGNQSLAITNVYEAASGSVDMRFCEVDILDTGTTTAAAFYAAGSGASIVHRNNITVEVGSGAGYGIFLSGTVDCRSTYNYISVTDTGGLSYSYYLGNGTSLMTQFDDVVADDEYNDAGGSIAGVYSEQNGLLEVYKTSEPMVALHNPTKEDTDGGREGSIVWHGEQSGGEETTLAKILAAHDGASDDQKGDLIFYTNDGTDNDTPTERLRIDSAGLATFTGAATVNGVVTMDSTASIGGQLSMADNIIERPVLKDYGETKVDIDSDTTPTVDLESGNVFTDTIDTGATTYTFSNPPASGTAGSFTLIMTNGGSQTVTWPAAVDWHGGTAPTLTGAGIDILTFFTIDAGNIWYGFVCGQDMK